MKKNTLVLFALYMFFISSINSLASFDFRAETTEASTTFGFRVYGAVDFQVSWDGGSTWEDAVSGNQLLANDYGEAGIREISVTGTATRIAFYGSGCTPALLTDITSKLSDGITGINSAREMFRDCTNITAFAQSDWFDDVSGNVTEMQNMFQTARNFDQDIGGWTVSNVTTMFFMFSGASSFNNGGSDSIRNWNTQNVANMQNMFASASRFNQPIGDWDVSKVENMSNMFQSASDFNNGGSDSIKNWDTSRVPAMGNMFRNASSFNQDIGGWTVTNVTSMSGMFYDATIFNNGGSDSINDWDTSNVVNMSTMFWGARAFAQDIGSWDTSNVQNMNAMLRWTDSFDWDVSSWDVSNVTDMTGFLFGAELSQGHYDKLLVAWSQQPLQSDLDFHGGTSIYGLEGAGGRITMLKTFEWTFTTDGGLVAHAEYEVTNPMELQGCAMHQDKTYKLVNDIDLSGTETWNAGAGFWPIMGPNAEPFSGTFDGGGHILSGLHIARPATDYVGLFGEITGTVSNLGVTGSVSGNDYVGGFAGALGSGAVIEDCFARVSVTAASDSAHRGGFCGRNEQGAIRRVYASGTVLPAGGIDGGGLTGSKDTGGGYEDANNFWDTDVTGWDTSAMGAGKTTKQMNAIETFIAWDIEESLDKINDGYPYFGVMAESTWRIYTPPKGTVFSIR